MSYPPAGTAASEAAVAEYLLDLGARKEFRSLAPPPAPAGAPAPPAHPYGFGLPGGPPAPPIPVLGGLRLHGAQVFVDNLMSPDSPVERLVINWQTGQGKSIAAITIALEYVRQYRSRVTVAPADRPTVFVVGFTKAIFQAEMLRHPEFGFVSREEAAELRRLRALAEASGGPASPESRQHAGLAGVFKRRITDRARGGYFQFYGYKEFANRLFTVTRRGAAKKFTVEGLYARPEVADDGSGGAAAAEPTFLDRIEAAVAAGDVEVNRELLAELRGGLVVADEIHNTYNIQSKNNYGIALQYALDRLGAEAPRAVFMSATVTGGAATEVVDLLNFLVPPRALPGGRRLRRADFFRAAERPDGRRAAALLPGALDRIGLLAAGRVSFLLDTDEAAYPRRIFEGVPLPDPARPGADIAYLRFTPCPMAALHEQTLGRMLADRPGDARAPVPANAYTLYDMVYPNPEFPPDAARTVPAGAVGLYLSAETPARLGTAPAGWLTAAGVTVEPFRGAGARGGGTAIIAGDFLDLDARPAAPPGLRYYSAKYQRLGEDLLGILRAGPGKVLIYHHRVRMSGVLQIEALLGEIGFVDEATAPSPSTLCGVCGTPRQAHTAKAAAETWAGPHAYAPARYTMAHSDIDRPAVERNVSRFSAQSNAEGYECRVLAGSKIIREGFDIKAVRHELIVSLPTDIPTLLQVFGRVVRKDSHAGLPADQRDVRIRIYVSTAGELTGGRGPAPEVARYAEKMEAYALTQEVDRAIRRTAVDGYINYVRMIAADPALAETATIDAIPYRPIVSLDDVRQRPETTATFEAYGHGDREVETLKAVIRALFDAQPVWTFDDLWAAARAGRVARVAQDPASFGEDSFALALDALGLHDPAVRHGDRAAEPALISRVGRYYIRAPASPAGQPVLDVESYVREGRAAAPLRIRVADYVRASRRGANFAVRLDEFEAEFGAAGARIEDMLLRYDADFHYALLKAIVEGDAGDEAAAEVARRLADPDSALARARDLYTRFRVLVLGRDIAAAPEALRVYRSARPPRAGSAAPVGYVAETSVRLFDPDAARARRPEEWYDVPRKALGIGARYAENDVAVGYVELRGAALRFKIRPPIQELSRANVKDVRSLARGAVCETRPRPEQEAIALSLRAAVGGRVPRDAAALAGFSSADLCVAIRLKLLALEEASRGRKTGMLDGPRWFYLFNDPLPTVSLGR